MYSKAELFLSQMILTQPALTRVTKPRRSEPRRYEPPADLVQVQIVGGPLLHSKKGGDGYVDTEEKMNKIFQGVEEALAAE